VSQHRWENPHALVGDDSFQFGPRRPITTTLRQTGTVPPTTCEDLLLQDVDAAPTGLHSRQPILARIIQPAHVCIDATSHSQRWWEEVGTTGDPPQTTAKNPTRRKRESGIVLPARPRRGLGAQERRPGAKPERATTRTTTPTTATTVTPAARRRPGPLLQILVEPATTAYVAAWVCSPDLAPLGRVVLTHGGANPS
jgi:hypothetical protein